MNKTLLRLKADRICWRHFTRRGYAAFSSLHKEISIGVLSVATLLAAAPSSAAGGHSVMTMCANGDAAYASDAWAESDEEPDLTILQPGDLLFNAVAQRVGTGGAIADVTQGVASEPIVHVAIVCRHAGQTYALEASGKHGVWLNPIDSFFVHSDHSPEGKPLVLVGRLRDQSVVAESLSRAMKYVGRPYDYLFGESEDSIYCSELVHYAFRKADGSFVFPQQPMSFHDNTGKVTQFWKDVYSRHGREVPEGEPGTNPGAISRSEEIEIVKCYYK